MDNMTSEKYLAKTFQLQPGGWQYYDYKGLIFFTHFLEYN